MPDDLDPSIKLALVEQQQPLNDRVTRVETTIEHHQEQMVVLGNKFDRLEEKLDGYHSDIIEALSTHTKEDRERYEDVVEKMGTNNRKITNLRAWIIGLGGGVGLVFAVIKVVPSIIAIFTAVQ